MSPLAAIATDERQVHRRVETATGKVDLFIPPPPVSDPRLPPPEGVAVDSHGNIYVGAVQAKQVYKYVKN